MDCPVCKTTKLVMSERNGIEIDYCPNCRGVWLDRGELDKIIDRSLQQPPQQQQQQQQSQQPYPTHDHRRYYDDDYKYKRKKREGFLGDLFDF